MVPQEEEALKRGENTRLTNRGTEKTFHEMMIAMRNSLSDLRRYDDGEDREDQDDEVTEQG